MSGFEQQLHGYRQGHQLLSSTVRLPKIDQDLIDRLSDVAGPLSPSERFSPYLTLYPLPSENYYVVARTWQDLDAPRAGCVRTRSVLIPMSEWQEAEDLASIVAIATEAGPSDPAVRSALSGVERLLPPVEPQHGIELIEALFLEERAPIVVFDADMPEPLALRLATALWPAFRRTFCMSTFARSPRTIGRRSFDLVFASNEARSQFADWKGRRIDGRKRGQARHPWSKPIVEQILGAKVPSLKSLDVLGEMSSDGIGSESALRVSLLWDELRRKLPNSPTAALGMLDIANTRKARPVSLIRELEPALARSATMAATTMQVEDAWRYLSALIQKLEGIHPLPAARSLRETAVDLAACHPMSTLDAISALNIEPQKALLMGAAADGVSRSLGIEVVERLSRLDGQDLLELVVASSSLAERVIGNFPTFSPALALALGSADEDERAKARLRLLGFLVEDFHAEPARLLISDLDVDGLVNEAIHVHAVNGLSSPEIRSIVVERARALHAEPTLREAVSGLVTSAGSDSLVEATLRPTSADLDWLLNSPTLKQGRRNELIRSMLAEAKPQQLRNMLVDKFALTKVIALLDAADNSDVGLLTRIAYNVAIPSHEYVALIVALRPKLNTSMGIKLIGKAIEYALSQSEDEVSLDVLTDLLSAIDGRFNGGQAMRIGLHRRVSSDAASRNLVAFGRVSSRMRRSILSGIEEMAEALTERHRLDISIEAAEVAADLLWESRSVTANGFVRASAILLPFLLNDRREVASPLIAAAFPPVYVELAKGSAFDLLSMMFVFLDWDKSKSARHRLVDSFFRSEWRISDIAIAAVRAEDPIRILRMVGNVSGGARELRDLATNLMQLPSEVRGPLRAALAELKLV